MLNYYFAPMEGITGHLFRQIHHEIFPGVDRYYIPFIAPHLNGSLKNKEKTDCLPANNAGLYAVPQILSNDAPSFLMTAEWLADLGYDMVDLNLGCPSPTVVTKGKGAGSLADPARLAAFFDRVFENDLPLKLSVKTRLGLTDPSEAAGLFDVYDRYPFEEIIVHARTRDQYYKGEADRETFRQIALRTRHTLCYNGNLYTPEDVRRFEGSFPQTDYPGIKAVMIGRGLLRNPALVRECQGGAPLEIAELKAFHDALYAVYKEALSGPAHLLGHMKELWIYWETILTEDSAKVVKKVRKARSAEEYERAAASAFAEAELMETEAYPRATEKIRL